MFNLISHSSFNALTELHNKSRYPKTNAYFPKGDEDKLVMEFALAGFSEDDLSVSCRGGYLNISATKKETPQGEDSDVYIFKGIAARTFKTSIPIGIYKVQEATFKNGLLSISMEKKEEHRIEIKG